ncbi:Cyclin-dependent kinase 16 [Clonorchis sinensis]|uniref:cyclin-dependent kinase n=1 Tax=Clonorchis sinensis TaxID=79923 RepID=A0A419PH86_CLOSI|nr:Cyclin-dependent kinase 16 [Clonorchis sinensis]
MSTEKNHIRTNLDTASRYSKSLDDPKIIKQGPEEYQISELNDNLRNGGDDFHAVDGWKLTELRKSNPNIYKNMHLLEIPAYLSRSQDLTTLNRLYTNGTPFSNVNSSNKPSDAQPKVKLRRDKIFSRKKGKSHPNITTPQLTTFSAHFPAAEQWLSVQPEKQDKRRGKPGRWHSMDQLSVSDSNDRVRPNKMGSIENGSNGCRVQAYPTNEEANGQMGVLNDTKLRLQKRPKSEMAITSDESRSSFPHQTHEQGLDTPTDGSVTRPSGARIPRVSSRRELRHSMHELGFGKAESYKKLELIGEGTYASVYKGYSMLLERIVALKEIRMEETEGAPCTAIREISLLRHLRHANIVTLHDVIYAPNSLTLVFEYVEQDLRNYMAAHKNRLPMDTVKSFMCQIFRALAFCHERRILHRDLKPQNLLITKNRELKLADFGLARAKSIPTKTYSNEVATLWYRPPDVLLGDRNYSGHIDIWGAGCIFYEMVTGRTPFPGDSKENQIFVIFKKLGIPPETYWPGLRQNEKFRTIVLSDSPDSSSTGRFFSMSSAKSTDNETGVQEFTDHIRGMLRGRVTCLDTNGLDLLTQCLHLLGARRITAADALNHNYFDDVLPGNLDLRNLSPEHSIYVNTDSVSKGKNVHTTGRKYLNQPSACNRLNLYASSMDDVRVRSSTFDPEVSLKAESEKRSVRNSWVEDTDHAHTNSPWDTKALLTDTQDIHPCVVKDSTAGPTESRKSVSEAKGSKSKGRRVKFEVVGYELGSQFNPVTITTPEIFNNDLNLNQKHFTNDMIKPAQRRPSLQRILNNFGNGTAIQSSVPHRPLEREVYIRPSRLSEIADSASGKERKFRGQAKQPKTVSIRPPLAPLHRENTNREQGSNRISVTKPNRLSITELTSRGAKPGGPLRVFDPTWMLSSNTPVSDTSHTGGKNPAVPRASSPTKAYRKTSHPDGSEALLPMKKTTPQLLITDRRTPNQMIPRPVPKYNHTYPNGIKSTNEDDAMLDPANYSALQGALEMLDGACQS